MADRRIIEWAEELQSIAQAGLFYDKDVFGQERYQRIRKIAWEMMAEESGLGKEEIEKVYSKEYGYQTPKVDTRAVIFQDDQILLVRETNGKWVLPGGWCDFNLTPVENTIKESREESGLDVRVLRLIAVQDRDRHCSPPYPFRIIKLFFLCEAIGGAFQENSETTERAYFSEEELPEINTVKIGVDQIHMCFEQYRNGFKEVVIE